MSLPSNRAANRNRRPPGPPKAYGNGSPENTNYKPRAKLPAKDPRKG